MGYVGVTFGSLAALLIAWTWRFLLSAAVRPYFQARWLRQQGVLGPKGRFWSGNLDEIKQLEKENRDLVIDINSHDYLYRVLPHITKWNSQYGGTFLYFFGLKPRLVISNPELVKQIMSSSFSFYSKTDAGPGITALLGKGLVLVEGDVWARHRRVVSPAFSIDKLKTMMRAMVECAQSMLDKWDGKKEVEVGTMFQELTADIISHASFGSSYSDAREVFLAQKELQRMALESLLMWEFPFKRYLPTESNKHRWRIEKKLRETLVSIIEKRLACKEMGYGNDLLGLMMEACMVERQKMSMDEIIDECKTFFFAGHETTSHLLTWTVFLLSTHQEWQERLREEVFRECGKETPDPDKISRLKLMAMVLFEALRLYSPVVLTSRTAQKDLKLGDLMIPKGTVIMIPIAAIHHSKDYWGADANVFNPLRFENGVSRAAKHPNAMLAFSLGPRACVGQNFALMEAKTVLSIVLQRYSFTLSADYNHMPENSLTLQPKKGLPIFIKPLDK